VTVQLAALRLQPADEIVELRGEPQVRYLRAALDTTRTGHQHVEVVHPSEQVLGLLEQRELSAERAQGSRPGRDRCPGATHLPHHLERVAELLGGHPDLVEPIGQVDPGRAFDGRTQPIGAPGRAPARGRPPGGPADAEVRRLRKGAHRRERLLLHARPVPAADLLHRACVRHAALAGNGLTDALERRRRPVSLVLELVQHLERDVQLAHGSERPCEPPHGALELPPAGARRQQRQPFAQPARRDTCPVNRLHVAGACARQTAAHGVDMLPHQGLRYRTPLHRTEPSYRHRTGT
jgi:hypothetical protein